MFGGVHSAWLSRPGGTPGWEGALRWTERFPVQAVVA